MAYNTETLKARAIEVIKKKQTNLYRRYLCNVGYLQSQLIFTNHFPRQASNDFQRAKQLIRRKQNKFKSRTAKEMV